MTRISYSRCQMWLPVQSIASCAEQGHASIATPYQRRLDRTRNALKEQLRLPLPDVLESSHITRHEIGFSLASSQDSCTFPTPPYPLAGWWVQRCLALIEQAPGKCFVFIYLCARRFLCTTTQNPRLQPIRLPCIQPHRSGFNYAKKPDSRGSAAKKSDKGSPKRSSKEGKRVGYLVNEEL